ncbi:hypothetical protein Tco_1244000 [Tanacetum coccineum]
MKLRQKRVMKKAFKTCLHDLGEVNPTQHNYKRTSQASEDPSWSTSIKTRRQRRHLQHWKRFGCHFILLYLYLLGTLAPEDPQTPPVPQDEDEREPMFVQAHDPDYVLEPVYPEYIPLEDEHVFPTEEQPLPPVDSSSPTRWSHPGIVLSRDPEEDSEEYEDDETEDGPLTILITGQRIWEMMNETDYSSGDDAR